MSNLEKINKEPEFREYMSLEEDFRKIRNSLLTQAKKEAAAKAAAKAAAEAREKALKEGREEGRKKGLEQGLEQGILQTAKNLVNMNMPFEDISKATGLSIEQIESLK